MLPASHYKGVPDGETDPAKPGLVEFRVSIGSVGRACSAYGPLQERSFLNTLNMRFFEERNLIDAIEKKRIYGVQSPFAGTSAFFSGLCGAARSATILSTVSCGVRCEVSRFITPHL